jgi:hypothetical protein
MGLKIFQISLISTIRSQKLKVKLAFLKDLAAEHGCFKVFISLKSLAHLRMMPSVNGVPVESFFRSGVTSPNLTIANCLTSSTCFQKVDFFIGPTGTNKTRIRQTEVMLMANSIVPVKFVERSSTDDVDQVRLVLKLDVRCLNPKRSTLIMKCKNWN